MMKRVRSAVADPQDAEAQDRDEPTLDQVADALLRHVADELREALKAIAERQWDVDRETEASRVLREVQEIARNALK